MSPFNLFRKTPKKNPPKPASMDNPFASPELQKKRYDAAVEFLGVLQKEFLAPNDNGHAGTVLAAAAWLAGTSLYRSLGYQHDHTPGGMVLSNAVNEKWPTLMNVFLYYCCQDGFNIKPDQLVLHIPDEHKPQRDIIQVQEQFQD